MVVFYLQFFFTGRSMFYFCWVSVAHKQTFRNYSWGLLVGPYIILFCTSVTILVFATVVLWKRLPTSNKTRTHILKQNAWCVFVLTSEILTAGGIWMSEYISIRKSRLDIPNFCCQHSCACNSICYCAQLERYGWLYNMVCNIFNWTKRHTLFMEPNFHAV